MVFGNDRSSHPALSYADGLAASSADIVLLIARILLAWAFVRSGYGKMFNIDATVAAYVSRGIPTAIAYLAIPVEFFGGLALMFGFATRYMAILMFAFTLIATLTSHRYWDFTEAVARRAQDSNFYKNMSMLGGFAALFVCGGGRFSLDGWLRKRG
jgi:putative oxidoreductase